MMKSEGIPLNGHHKQSYDVPKRSGSHHSTTNMKKKMMKLAKENKLVIAIVIGAVLGTIIGISINSPIQRLPQPDRYTAILVIGFPGELLLRALKMLILPLITFSLIVGLSNLNQNVSGKIGARAVTYYLSTTVLAAILGIILVSAIRPGIGMDPPESSKKTELVRPLDSFFDILRNMFPSNIVKAAVQQDKTIIVVKKELSNPTNKTFDFNTMTTNETAAILKKYTIHKTIDPNTGDVINYTTIYDINNYTIGEGLKHPGKANFLGLIIFAIVVGKIAGGMGNRAKPFVEFVTVFNEIITQIVIYVMWCAPFGILSLIAAQFAQMEDIASTFESLALFMVTVSLGVFAHGFIVLPFIFWLFTRTNPFRYIQGLTEALFTAFGTDSSAATLPITMRCLEENLHLDRRITRFILPVGATINMDGTALYEAVSAIFIAQSVGASLSFGDYVAISFTSILASVGAAAIPHAGLVTMLIVLDTVGLPTEMVGIIFTVDWLLDRFRTVVNVLGDAFGTGIVQHLSQTDLKKSEEENTAKIDQIQTDNESRIDISEDNGLN
ncbi:excitatory amino acid transporter-like [Clytia hemisphaerica]|uniref:Amino acid transporter n=1 Tax=Clytia hemisphaerica TaxID=252671 RepID=A0A7M5VAJ7_9CNID